MSGDDETTDVDTKPSEQSSGSLSSDTHQIQLDPTAIAQPEFGRYEIGDVLGKGGMGEVRACRDRGIGRRVAMKVLRQRFAARPGFQRRFFREARVQGQLEHPCIVPVYEIGLTPDGEPYFTMKRVKGTTLRKILRRLRQGDQTTAASYSRRKLLTAFSSVCLAVHAAHRGGVVHRDIKPENIMFGDFGEVYVLDWGIASLAGEVEDAAEPVEDPDSVGLTRSGAVLGTPRYMSPEQAKGAVDSRSDVYALGAVLFEMLTLEPLVIGARSSEDAMTLPVSHPAGVASDADDDLVPPELLAICRQATALDVDERYQDARALQLAVERFLDGDRDLELRNRMAEEVADRASRVAARALDADGTMADRAEALRDAGRALGLDPSNARALQVMLELLTVPPSTIPEPAQAEFEQGYRRMNQRTARVAGFLFLVPIGAFVFVAWAGIRSWFGLAVCVSAFVLASALSFWLARKPNASRSWRIAAIASGFVPLSACSYAFGPFIIVPALVCILVAGAVMYFPFARRSWFAVIASLTLVVPLLLDWTGVLSPAYVFTDAGMLVMPRLNELPAVPTTVSLLVFHIFTITSCTYFFGWLRDQLGRSEQQLHLQSWQLRQLLPDAASRQLLLDDSGDDGGRVELASRP